MVQRPMHPTQALLQLLKVVSICTALVQLVITRLTAAVLLGRCKARSTAPLAPDHSPDPGHGVLQCPCHEGILSIHH
jgi:hypothetical protein